MYAAGKRYLAEHFYNAIRTIGHSFITVQITAPVTLSSSEADRLALIFTASPLVFDLIVTNSQHFLHAWHGRVITLEGPCLFSGK